MMSFPKGRGRARLLAAVIGLPALQAAADVTPLRDDSRPLLDGAVLGDGSTPPVGDPSWVLNAVEPDATALVQPPVALAMELPAARRAEAPAPAPLLAAAPGRNWVRVLQIGAPPIVLVVGASLLVWFARHAGRRHRHGRHSRRRGH